ASAAPTLAGPERSATAPKSPVPPLPTVGPPETPQSRDIDERRDTEGPAAPTGSHPHHKERRPVPPEGGRRPGPDWAPSTRSQQRRSRLLQPSRLNTCRSPSAAGDRSGRGSEAYPESRASSLSPGSGS